MWTLLGRYDSMREMQTLGISNSPVKSEGRLKSLLWPSVQTSNDVDYLGAQGYWVCTIVAVLSFVVSIIGSHPIAGFFVLFFYYLGGIGVRERSRYAAAAVLALYVSDSLLSIAGNPIIKILISALLLANLRATWIAARWEPQTDEATSVPRFGETWSDKFADQLPMWLWPKLRIPYYIFSGVFLALQAIGIVVLMHRHAL